MDPVDEDTPTVHQGVLAQIENLPTESTIPSDLTENDIRDAFNDIMGVPADRVNPDIKVEKAKMSDFDAVGFLKHAEIKKWLTPILQELYPDKWEWNEKDEILIHFPKIKMTNSKGLQHDITNMYAMLRYQHINKMFSGTLRGARSTRTGSEQTNSYIHSHLPSTGLCNFGSFCLGSSTLGMLLSDLATIQPTPERLEDLKLRFMLVLMEIENYLGWESVEGGPYKYMKDIAMGSLSMNLSSTYGRIAERIMDEIYPEFKRDNNLLFKFNKKGLIDIVKNHNFLLLISKYCPEKHLVYRSSTGRFYSEKSETRVKLGKVVDGTTFNFKGETIIGEIVSEVKIYEESEKEFAHPSIVESCRKKFGYELNKVWGQELSGKIVKGNFQRKRKVKNTKQSLFTNLTSMPTSTEP